MKTRPRRRKNARPTTLGDLLAATAPGRAAKTTLITRTLWQTVAGVAFAKRTKPDRLERGTLHVLCASSGWAQELALHAPLILERLQARGIEVERIRFRVTEVEPPDHPGAHAPTAAELARARAVEADPKLVARLAVIESDALRDTLARTARAVARRAAEVEAHARAAQDRKPSVPGRKPGR